VPKIFFTVEISMESLTGKSQGIFGARAGAAPRDQLVSGACGDVRGGIDRPAVLEDLKMNMGAG
jgi:hypothetical protein